MLSASHSAAPESAIKKLFGANGCLFLELAADGKDIALGNGCLVVS
jgi:hypothetical protein